MPAVQYPDLSKMFGQYSMYPTSIGLDREATANQNNALDQANTLSTIMQRQAQEKRLADESAAKIAMDQANQKKLLQQLDKSAADAKFNNTGAMMQQLEQWGNIAEQNGGSIPLALQNQMPEGIREVFANPDGWKIAKQAGQAYRENSAKWLKEAADRTTKENVATTGADAKNYAADAATRRAREANASRERIAAMRTDAMKLIADKRNQKTDKLSLEQYLVELDKQRNNVAIDDPQAYDVLTRRIYEVQQRLEQIKSAGAAEQSSLPRDIMGRTTPGSGPRSNKTTPPPQGAPAPAATNKDPFAGFTIR